MAPKSLPRVCLVKEKVFVSSSDSVSKIYENDLQNSKRCLSYYYQFIIKYTTQKQHMEEMHRARCEGRYLPMKYYFAS